MNSMGAPVRRGVGGFADGAGYFLKGFAWVARHPRQWLFGLVPALIALVLYVAALLLLGMYAGDFAAWATPFADGWSTALRDTLRILLGIVVFALGLVLSVITFTAVTLLIGGPFYEKLSERVEDSLGGAVKAQETPFWRSTVRSVRDSLITLLYVLAFTIPLFALGFVPVVGQTVVPVLGAAVSGFFLTVELSTLAMERRGLARRQRFAILRGDKSPALGFGVLAFLAFLIPFGAVVAMPAAVAGATLMVRQRLTPETPVTPIPPPM
ncbi:EI24 domain-containing protein [Sphaerisporangium sp. TRM90804]|uniref:EI24 domain-containing protein n=1 Tax=Sphaerisporangium sp. TRM90804 TaxID=3031113 RepID=UPI002447AC1F|nr:EI24 domain-containing protein [Sphaerisporangium sp. TRM90804]MDH2428188.1 EI24 domain-containing protein [Sphaerisporangium sp. TRM90804]